ncbi:hypothetical protein [Thalassotalea maritima]|uniref:hypothetical protein n=1 Tax=Thalassotalea maritima TaxID=3242416 RepID=UPI0035284FCE
MDINFSALQSEINSKFTSNGWTKIYALEDDDSVGNSCGIYCGLVSDQFLSKELEDNSWGISYCRAAPGLIFGFENGERNWRYDRFSDNCVEPLLIYRRHPITNKRIITLSDEFLLYFNLFETKTDDSITYCWFDDNAESHDVVVINANEAKVKTKFLRQYLNIRKMNLCIYFDSSQYSKSSLEELGLIAKNDLIKTEEAIYSDGCRDIADYGIRNDLTHSWMMGKIVITRTKDFTPSSFEHFTEGEPEEYHIGYDESGDDVFFTCQESKLSNYYKRIEGAPFVLTPVYFDRDVLKKYYDNPKYTVADGKVSLDGFWSLPVDNNIGSYVSVFLGDLSRLPTKEQKYWKSYNIPPQGGISKTNLSRSFNGDFATPDAVDNYFKYKLKSFNETWHAKYGWYIFKPLAKGDMHYLTALHVPSKGNQKEFEEQVLALTKIIIDSINDKELTKSIAELSKEAKRLEKLQAYLETHTGASFTELIEYLRMLQRLRSTNVAHRKGSRPDKSVISYFKLDADNYYEAFSEILLKAIRVINTLEYYFLEAENN